MIDLKGAILVGKGCRRIVYVHPDDDSRCIKVQTAEALAKTHRQKAHERELYYLAFYERRGRRMDQVSSYHGSVATSEGEGQLFDLVRDHDGRISRTLAAKLAGGEIELEGCRREFEQLRNYLSGEGIIVADLHAGNLARQEWEPGKFRFVVIDGIGNTEFLKINDYLRWTARRKAERKWSCFMKKLIHEWRAAE